MITHRDARIHDDGVCFVQRPVLMLDGIQAHLGKPCPYGRMAGRIAKKTMKHEVEHLQTLCSLAGAAAHVDAEKECRHHHESGVSVPFNSFKSNCCCSLLSVAVLASFFFDALQLDRLALRTSDFNSLISSCALASFCSNRSIFLSLFMSKYLIFRYKDTKNI